MRQGRNKLCLHFFVLVDLIGHIVDGLRQIANFIVIFGLNLYPVAASGDPFCRRRNLRHRLQDRTNIKIAAQEHNQNKQASRCNGRQSHKGQLSVYNFHTGHIAQNADYLSAGVNHGAGNRHNPFSRGRVFAHIGGHFSGFHRIGNVRSRRGNACPLTIRGCHQTTAGIDELQLNGIFFLKGPGIGRTGLVVLTIALPDIACKKFRRRLGPMAHVRLHVGIVICRYGSRNQDHKNGSQHRNRTDRVGHPTATQAPYSFHPALSLSGFSDLWLAAD